MNELPLATFYLVRTARFLRSENFGLTVFQSRPQEGVRDRCQELRSVRQDRKSRLSFVTLDTVMLQATPSWVTTHL